MKLDKNSKYFHMGIHLFLVIAASMLFFMFLRNISYFSGILSWFMRIIAPFMYAFALAYLLNPVMAFFESLILSRRKTTPNVFRARRISSLLLTYIIVIICIVVSGYIVLPQIASSVYGIIVNVQYYISLISIWSSEFLDVCQERFSIDPFYIEQLLNQAFSYASEWARNLSQYLPQLYDFTISVTTGVKNFILAFVISIYMLYSKEIFMAQVKKLCFAILPKHIAAKLIYITRLIDKSFGGFISGKIIDSLIIGILCFIGMSILNIDYAVLISVIVGITNVIPYFGPFLGAIPSILIVFFISPLKSLVLALFILALQQFDGNILGPKILGDSIGLPPFWILFSVIVGGGMFGIPGMFFGVPVFAVIYTLLKSFLKFSLQKKGLPSSTDDYKNGDFPGAIPPDLSNETLPE